MGVDKDPHLMAWNQLKSLCRDHGYTIAMQFNHNERWVLVLTNESEEKKFTNKSINAAIKKAGGWARGDECT